VLKTALEVAQVGEGVVRNAASDKPLVGKELEEALPRCQHPRSKCRTRQCPSMATVSDVLLATLLERRHPLC
jgi:hypothetical protein